MAILNDACDISSQIEPPNDWDTWEIAKQNDVSNTRLRESGKQNELTFKKFGIWITRASHLINN